MNHPTEPARVRAVSALRRWIADGTLPAGSCLPSERALADRLSVSKPSVHRALQVLERDGVISRAVGRTRTVFGSLAPGLLAQTVVVLAPAKEAWHRASTGFTDHVAEGAHDAIAQAGWHSLAFHPERADERGIAALLAQRPAGVVLPEPRDRGRPAHELAARLRDGGIPVAVNADGGAWAAFDRAVCDHHAGGAALVRFLQSRGRRRLATVWTPGAAGGWWHRARMAGMAAAATEGGIAAPHLHVAAAPEPDGDPWAAAADTAAYLEQHARNWLGQVVELLRGPQPVDGLLVHSDGDALAIGRACRLLGLEPGRDLDVVGFDHALPVLPHFDRAAGLVQATVDKCNRDQGAALVALLLERAAATTPAVVRRVQPELVSLV